ncbi:MAG: hypothetical protein ACPF9I_06445 [Candidatus Thalassarchaeaceae archaeon]
MGSRYVNITKEEMDRFLIDAQGFEEMDFPYAEVVYQRPAKREGTFIRIYSSIHKGHRYGGMEGRARRAGKDAIRTVLLSKDASRMYHSPDGYKGIKKYKRVHRTKNWRLNLLSRYDSDL